MLDKLKSNNSKRIFKIFNIKQIFTLILISIILIFVSNPKTYSSSCLNGLSIWATNVLPVLFPFFVLTRLILSLISFKKSPIDKFFKKVYHTPITSFYVFILSILSGYPMGAKLVSYMYKNGVYTKLDAEKMLSFCSISGPMFIIGTVGVGFLNSFKAGIVILVSNILACLFNGLVFRGKIEDQNEIVEISNQINSTNLSEIVYDSLISILMVGAYIVLSFLMIDVLKNLGLINVLSNTICSVFNLKTSKSVVESTLIGFFEITRGIFELKQNFISLQIKTILSSGIIGFGGFSVFLQSVSFLNELKIKKGFILLQKISQGLLSFIIAVPLSFLII